MWRSAAPGSHRPSWWAGADADAPADATILAGAARLALPGTGLLAAGGEEGRRGEERFLTRGLACVLGHSCSLPSAFGSALSRLCFQSANWPLDLDTKHTGRERERKKKNPLARL